MNRFDIFNDAKEKIDENIIKEVLDKAFSYEKIDNVYFSIIITDNNKIRKINREYRNIDRETDVISFALEDDKVFPEIDIRVLGDIYISLDKVKEQSKLYGHSEKRELAFLTVHGLLHLLGYDHMDKHDEEIMFKKQDEILELANIRKED